MQFAPDAVAFWISFHERVFGLNVVWTAVETTGFYVKAEFACDAHAVAERGERFSHKLFARVRTVDVGGIKERHASAMRLTNDLDALVSVCRRSIVGADAHAPASDS
jgi:hypothetical protein